MILGAGGSCSTSRWFEIQEKMCREVAGEKRGEIVMSHVFVDLSSPSIPFLVHIHVVSCWEGAWWALAPTG